MKTIFYGLAGEGLGHAGRTQAVVEHLGGEFEVHLFTWGEAYEFFDKLNCPRLHEIAGCHFGRKADNSISAWGSVRNFFRYLAVYGDSVRDVVRLAGIYEPSLFIADCDGIIPRAAKACKKPMLSIDNQHKFSRTSFAGLPVRLRFHAFFMGLGAEWLCPVPDFAVVSTFYHSPVRKRYLERTALVNCLVRKAIEEKTPHDGGYVLLYYKTSVGDRMLRELVLTGRRVVVYNCPPHRRLFNGVDYRDVDNEGFIDALVGCTALFCSAGNVLLGEAIFCGKKIFAVPEPNQPEQTANAFHLQDMGLGATCTVQEFSLGRVEVFMGKFQPNQVRPANGVYEAVKHIRRLA